MSYFLCIKHESFIAHTAEKAFDFTVLEPMRIKIAFALCSVCAVRAFQANCQMFLGMSR